MAICAAVKLVNSSTTNETTKVRILSRSRSAVQTVANGKLKGDQCLCTEIANSMATKAVEVHWLPTLASERHRQVWQRRGQWGLSTETEQHTACLEKGTYSSLISYSLV